MLGDDNLPQPYRFINKLVTKCVGEALDEIGYRLNSKNKVGKKFVPTQQGKPLPRLEEELPQYDTEGAASVVKSGYPETVIGRVDGTVSVHSTSMQTELHGTPPLFPSSVVAVDAVGIQAGTSHATTTIYAAACHDQVTVFHFSPRQDTATSGRGSNTPDSRRGSATSSAEGRNPTAGCYTNHCTLTSEFLHGRTIVGLKFSPDAAFLSIVFGSGNEVACYAIPAIYVNAKDTKSITEPIAMVDSLKFPQQYLTAPAPCVAEVHFLAHDPPPVMGYFREAYQAHPLTHTMVVGWTGQNVFTTVSLKDYAGTNKAHLKMAKELKQAVIEATAAAAVAPVTTKEAKGGKEGKGAKGNASGSAVVDPAVVPLPPLDPEPAPVRHRLLPQLLTAIAVHSNHSLVALGCLDGNIEVWNPATGVAERYFQEAKYRAEQNSVRFMLVSSLEFIDSEVLSSSSPADVISNTSGAAGNTGSAQKKNILAASLSLPTGQNHSKVMLLDVDTGATLSSVNYTSGWSFLVPIPSLPVFAFFGSGAWYLADARTGDLIIELPHVGWAPPTEVTNDLASLLRTTRRFKREVVGFEEMVASAVAVGGAIMDPIPVGGDNNKNSRASSPSQPPTANSKTPLPPSGAVPAAAAGANPTGPSKSPTPDPDLPVPREVGSITIKCIDTANAVRTGYTLLEKYFGTCSVDQLAHVLKTVAPDDRNDPLVVSKVQLPGLGGFLQRQPSAATSETGGAGRNTSFTSGHGSMIGRSQRALSAAGTGSGHPVIKVKGLPADATMHEIVRHTIEVREKGRAVRTTAFKQQWAMMKQSLA